jgi:hypothetical protein
MTTVRFWAAVLTACALGFTGCGGGTTVEKPKETTGHKHTHPGPHKGHVMEIGDKADHHAEWTYDDMGKVTFYILAADKKTDVPIAAEKLTIDVTIGGNPTTTYTLTAVDPKEGKASAFELTDPNLKGALQTNAAGNVLHVTIDGQEYKAEVKEIEFGDDHAH